MAQAWTDGLLDGMRLRGDAVADATIAELLREHGLERARDALLGVMRNGSAASEDLPQVLARYFRETSPALVREPEELLAGQRVFADHGPLILLCLACYSLPASYAAAKGVQVLHRTAYLEKRPTKRLFQTTQMVIDVMSPGGLGPDGRGVVAAQKVRLMHAMVRHLVRTDPRVPWPAELGTPINQEDMAGTLMTFSWIVLDGLAKLGVELSADEKQSYLTAWQHVGRLMGVEEVLIPADVAAAERLTKTIQARQIAPSDAGRLLTAALLGMLQSNMPAPGLQRMPPAMLRHFLPPHVSDFLGVEDHALDNVAFDVIAEVTGKVDAVIQGVSPLRHAVSHLGLLYVQSLIDVEVGKQGVPFAIPTHLRHHWALTPKPAGSVWDHILDAMSDTFRRELGL